MRCREAMAAAEDLLNARQPITDSQPVAQHLRACKRCASAVADLQALSRLATALPAGPAVAVDAIKRRVMQELAAGSPAPKTSRFALPPALVGALASAAVICVFVVGILVGKVAMGPRGPVPGPVTSMETPATPAPSGGSLAAPVFAVGSEEGSGRMAEPIVDRPPAAAPPAADTRRPAKSTRATASQRRPVIPRGDSVRTPGARPLPYTATQAPRAPEGGGRTEEDRRVRSYEIEVPELGIPTPSSPGIIRPSDAGAGDGEGGRIVLIVPGQEF